MSIQQTTAKITLDLYTKNVVSVNAKQYDNQTRYIEISCVENGIVFTVDKSIMSAFIRFKKPDDNGVFNEVEITSDGKLKIELTEQMLSASGRAIADVFLLRKVFTSNEKPTNIDDIYKINAPIISIMDFYINITPTALNHSQIESSYEFNALTNALAQIDFNNKKVVELDKTLTTNEDIRKQNETERKSNEESRINSEQKRVNEEDKRQKAEDIRVANENTRISNENTRQAQETKRQTDTAAAITNANAAAKNANDKANDLQNKLDNHHFVLTNELEDSVSSTSTVHAPTANAVKIAYDKAISVENTVNSNKNNWNDKYTKNEIDNKFSTLENNIDWKESVATFADIAKTYPNPEDGWTVNVKDTDYTYRYSGSKWVAISANAIPKATQSVDGLLSKEDKTNYDDANSKKHTHNNKTILDKIVSDPLLLTGGTMTGRIIREAGGTWIKDRENVAVFGSRSSSNSYNPVVGQKTPNGAWTIGNLATKEDLVFNYTTDANFNGRVNNSAPIYLPAASSESGSTIITTDTISEQSVKFATSANSAIKLTTSAGSATQPIYFSDGKPVACSIPLGGTTLSIAKEINLTDSKYNEDTWYPVVATVLIPRGGMYRLKCAAQLDGNCMPNWSNHTYKNGFTAILDLLTIQSGYGTTDANEIVLSYQQKFISDSKNPIGYKQLINSSKPVLWLRGGGIYQIYSEWNTEWTIITESTTITNETISPATTPPGLAFKKKSDIYANLQGSSTYLNGYQGSIPNTANESSGEDEWTNDYSDDFLIEVPIIKDGFLNYEDAHVIKTINHKCYTIDEPSSYEDFNLTYYYNPYTKDFYSVYYHEDFEGDISYSSSDTEWSGYTAKYMYHYIISHAQFSLIDVDATISIHDFSTRDNNFTIYVFNKKKIVKNVLTDEDFFGTLNNSSSQITIEYNGRDIYIINITKNLIRKLNFDTKTFKITL